MKYGFVIGVVALSVVMLHGIVVRGQDTGQSLRRSLTVEQTAIYNVQPNVGADALQVVAWVDRPDYTYAIGEEVRLFIEANQDAYVAVLNTDPSGQTTVLFPNRFQPDNFVRARRSVEVPNSASQIRIAVNPPVGTELLKVMASTEPFSVREALQLSETGAFPVVRTSAQGTARSLTVVMAGDTSAPDTAPVLSNTLGGRVTAPSPGRRQETGGAAAGAASTRLASGAAWAICHQAIRTISTPTTQVARLSRSLTVENRRSRESGASVRCEELALAQGRLQRAIDGPVTRETVTRLLVLVPTSAEDSDSPTEVSVMLRVAFGLDSAELNAQAMRDLDAVAAALNGPQLAREQLTLEGHTDATGTADYNLLLSQRRAEAVVEYLIQQGVAGRRLRPTGFGEFRLLPAYVPTDERQRRVEIVRTF